MNNIEHICRLINDKRAHLISYEAFSTKLVHCSIESFVEVLDQRDLIIQSINDLDGKILTVLNQTNDQDVLSIVQSRALINEIRHELLPLYYGVKSIQESLENIQDIEHIVQTQLNTYQEELRIESKLNNNVVKIKKYFETYETEIDEMTLMMSRTSKA